MLRHKTFKLILTTTVLSFMGFYFSSHAILGGKGLTYLIKLNEDFEQSTEQLTTLLVYKDYLENKISGLDEKTLDLDLLDEQVRKALGYAGRNETVIYKDES